MKSINRGNNCINIIMHFKFNALTCLSCPRDIFRVRSIVNARNEVTQEFGMIFYLPIFGTIKISVLSSDLNRLIYLVPKIGKRLKSLNVQGLYGQLRSLQTSTYIATNLSNILWSCGAYRCSYKKVTLIHCCHKTANFRVPKNFK